MINQLLKVNMYAKLFYNTPMHGSATEKTCQHTTHFHRWPLSVTLTFDLKTWAFYVTHYLIMENICGKLYYNSHMNGQGIAQGLIVDENPTSRECSPNNISQENWKTWLNIDQNILFIDIIIKYVWIKQFTGPSDNLWIIYKFETIYR